MPCYHPLTAYKAAGGGITFNEGGDSGPQLQLPCGRCIGCRIHRTREWAIRCLHEASLHDASCFVTLTYDQDKAGDVVSLDYTHFQKFLKRLRKAKDPDKIRFFAAGEYGEQNFRPHWHALLFGVHFTNQQPVGKNICRSAELEALWPYGFSSIGEINYTTATYVASYCIKKVTGKQADARYQRYNTDTGEIIHVTPEMAKMSLKPGIGAEWYKKYIREVSYARDAIVQAGGRTVKVPRYYDKLLQTIDIKQYTENETERLIQADKRREDNTEKRLLVKEINAYAKQSMKRRKL